VLQKITTWATTLLKANVVLQHGSPMKVVNNNSW
jgi:hypothetical protein